MLTCVKVYFFFLSMTVFVTSFFEIMLLHYKKSSSKTEYLKDIVLTLKKTYFCYFNKIKNCTLTLNCSHLPLMDQFNYGLGYYFLVTLNKSHVNLIFELCQENKYFSLLFTCGKILKHTRNKRYKELH